VYVCGKIAYQPQQHTTQVCLANKKMSNSTFTGKFPPHYFKGCHQVYSINIRVAKASFFPGLPVCGSKALKVSICVPLCPSGHGARKSAGGCFFLAKENTRQACSLSLYFVCTDHRKKHVKRELIGFRHGAVGLLFSDCLVMACSLTERDSDSISLSF
jgi:hypothetical protein